MAAIKPSIVREMTRLFEELAFDEEVIGLLDVFRS